MAFSSRDYIFLQEISSNIIPHDQQNPPTNNVATYRMRMQIFDATDIELRAQPIVNEVVDYEENYSEFSYDDDDDDEDDDEDEDVDVSKYSKTRTYHVPTMDLISGDHDMVDEACAICLIEYNEKDTIGTLQCGHEFHVECIKKWLMRKKTCPYCRAQLLPSHEKISSS
ncbi:hypothetical protein EJD97_013902 [Solanum chilense]|uniref:RING-type E3 ubiquitin transferase n=1 Tax=Solanum chilense TaxID=4083 RepID=A0A6N2BFF3_SOLCI|nr:hypothetical protein EJD97_013902 [Solanum chilense]